MSFQHDYIAFTGHVVFGWQQLTDNDPCLNATHSNDIVNDGVGADLKPSLLSKSMPMMTLLRSDC